MPPAASTRPLTNACSGWVFPTKSSYCNVVATSSVFLGVLDMVASVPLIATRPTRMTRRYGPAFGPHCISTPMTLAVPDISLVWTAHVDNDPASAWLRNQISGILR